MRAARAYTSNPVPKGARGPERPRPATERVHHGEEYYDSDGYLYSSDDL